MTVLVIWALLAGQPVMATHMFGNRGDCEPVKEIVYQHLKSEGAVHIVALCSQEPAL